MKVIPLDNMPYQQKQEYDELKELAFELQSKINDYKSNYNICCYDEFIEYLKDCQEVNDLYD